MEAFPYLAVISADNTLLKVIPPLLNRHCQMRCESLETWQQLEQMAAPILVVIDSFGVAEDEMLQLRRLHPLMAIIMIGEALPHLPLSAAFNRPIIPAELFKRVDHLLYARMHDADGQQLRLADDLVFFPQRRQIEREGAILELTEKENSLLLCLYHYPLGIARDHLLEMVWGYQGGVNSHTFETHLSRLRQKWRAISDNELITTENGNYRLASTIR